jgi:hypothetical protein
MWQFLNGFVTYAVHVLQDEHTHVKLIVHVIFLDFKQLGKGLGDYH